MCDSILSRIEINNECMMQYPYGNTWGFSVTPNQKRLFWMFMTKPQSAQRTKTNCPFRTNPTQPIGETPLRKAVSELAVKCKFDNPLQSTNHGAKALGHSIVENAPIQVPLGKRFNDSNHSNPIAGIPYQAQSREDAPRRNGPQHCTCTHSYPTNHPNQQHHPTT